MRCTPLLPASRLRQTSSRVLPTAQINPTPVTTTRRAELTASAPQMESVWEGSCGPCGGDPSSLRSSGITAAGSRPPRRTHARKARSLFLGVLINVVDGVLHGADLFRVLVGNLDIKGFLK